mmetsp:Transcript_47556/g.154359  ORF Transcript_47556/g.154359 Transcript_47556/m.154359 type:complete len:234 (-) Transcript_47556:480-1181(-)
MNYRVPARPSPRVGHAPSHYATPLEPPKANRSNRSRMAARILSRSSISCPFCRASALNSRCSDSVSSRLAASTGCNANARAASSSAPPRPGAAASRSVARPSPPPPPATPQPLAGGGCAPPVASAAPPPPGELSPPPPRATAAALDHPILERRASSCCSSHVTACSSASASLRCFCRSFFSFRLDALPASCSMPSRSDSAHCAACRSSVCAWKCESTSRTSSCWFCSSSSEVW